MLRHKRLIAHILAHILGQPRYQRFDNYRLFHRSILKSRKANRTFLVAHPGFKVPPLKLAYEAYNYTSWQSYYDLGMAHAKLIRKLMDENVRQAEVRVCEWGCGPARVIRHLTNLSGYSKVELVGTDYDEETIRWCQENIPDISFFKNELAPPLPFATHSIDVVYAISVLTHLSEKMQLAWIRELFRVLKPNGILIFTTHGNLVSNDELLPREKASYELGKLVTRTNDKEGAKSFTAFHPPEYVKKVLLTDFEVLTHIDNPIIYTLLQDVWVAKKKSSSMYAD